MRKAFFFAARPNAETYFAYTVPNVGKSLNYNVRLSYDWWHWTAANKAGILCRVW
ncbi:hypothetical protein SAMN02744133_1107 [Thalassospira xiamenensis M-5 = DSM 17429]|nr:hypothetical protein SAMN02744133_1107 [Thalassospira xiamenensis M-5 = DSM 17429]